MEMKTILVFQIREPKGSGIGRCSLLHILERESQSSVEEYSYRGV